MARKPPRGKNRDNARRSKKKVSILNTEGIKYVDWKDVDLLRRFMSDRAKIRARRVTGNNTQQQREIAQAIKVAREMALLPYTNRVTQQRGGRRGDRDRDGGSSGSAAGSERSAADSGCRRGTGRWCSTGRRGTSGRRGSGLGRRRGYR